MNFFINNKQSDNYKYTSTEHDNILINKDIDNYFNTLITKSTTEKPIVKSITSAYATNESYPLANSFGSYKDIYNSSSRIGDYPYNKSGSISVSPPLVQDKFTEKINYMINLLEEQQKEPTKHITEEFILYTFLGIFVIYIVDSFTRIGKYIR